MDVAISFATVNNNSSCSGNILGEPTFNTIQINAFASNFY